MIAVVKTVMIAGVWNNPNIIILRDWPKKASTQTV
jgi:hypothetical protein